MDKSISRLGLDRFQYLSDLVYVDFMRELRPKNDPGFWKATPYCPRRLHSRQTRHLNIQYAQVRAMLECQIHCGLAILGFNDRGMLCKLSLQQFAQVMPLGDVVFGN